MSKITKFTPAALSSLSADIDAALKEVCEKHGIGVKAGSFRYTNTTAKKSIEFLATADGGDVDPDKVLYERYALNKGLNPNAFGEEFEATDGNLYVVSGIKPKGKKYSLLAKDKRTGKQYGFPLHMLPAKIKR